MFSKIVVLKLPSNSIHYISPCLIWTPYGKDAFQKLLQEKYAKLSTVYLPLQCKMVHEIRTYTNSSKEASEGRPLSILLKQTNLTWELQTALFLSPAFL